MTYALPAGPAPAPRRQVLVATGVACAAGAMLLGGMLAVWLRFRAASPLREGSGGGLVKAWLPEGVTIPEVPSNVMLITFGVACVMAQWAVYAAKRGDHGHAGLALSVTALMGLAALNAQVFIYTQMEMGIGDGAYQVMFYALTGTFMALIVVGLLFSFAAAFRYLGGRFHERELISAHAMYWYFLAAAYATLWFVVYVQK